MGLLHDKVPEYFRQHREAPGHSWCLFSLSFLSKDTIKEYVCQLLMTDFADILKIIELMKLIFAFYEIVFLFICKK